MRKDLDPICRQFADDVRTADPAAAQGRLAREPIRQSTGNPICVVAGPVGVSKNGAAPRSLFSETVLAVLLFVSLCASASLAQPIPPGTQGYVARGCGFDLDDDGRRGEPEDCRVCDASLSLGRLVPGTADPDGDGVDEDFVYVDCDSGRDRRGCGLPGAPPCKTLRYALTQVDGPDDRAEDIVCFSGTCRGESDLTPQFGGVPGQTRLGPAGSEQRPFEFPSDPAMISGWDRDGDGVYPPFDEDDTSVLEGQGLPRAFLFNTPQAGQPYFELAHFSARNYGRESPGPKSGFLKLGHGRSSSHLLLHDLVLSGINQDRASTSGRITFDFFGVGRFRYGAFLNIHAPDNGGYLNRGAAPYETPGAGPFRWQNITASAHSCDQSGAQACAAGAPDAYWTGWKLWGYFEGLEILDSRIEANLGAWKPKSRGGPVGVLGIVAAECSLDWTIRNNRFLDNKTAFKVQNYAKGFCDAPASRPVSEVVFDRNQVLNQSDYWENALIAVGTGQGGPHASEANGSITISGNRFESAAGWNTTIDLETGNGGGLSPGRITVSGNTFRGGMRTADSAFLRVRSLHPFKDHADGLRIEENRFCEAGEGQLHIRTTFAPAGWTAKGNRFDPQGQFEWAGTRVPDLASWRVLSGQDRTSEEASCDESGPLGVERNVQSRVAREKTVEP